MDQLRLLIPRTAGALLRSPTARYRRQTECLAPTRWKSATRPAVAFSATPRCRHRLASGQRRAVASSASTVGITGRRTSRQASPPSSPYRLPTTTRSPCGGVRRVSKSRSTRKLPRSLRTTTATMTTMRGCTAGIICALLSTAKILRLALTARNSSPSATRPQAKTYGWVTRPTQLPRSSSDHGRCYTVPTGPTSGATWTPSNSPRATPRGSAVATPYRLPSLTTMWAAAHPNCSATGRAH